MKYPQCNIEAYVLDSARYQQWDDEPFKSTVHYVCNSVENLLEIFEKETFDIVFANRVFHHFVDKTYKKTLSGMQRAMAAISIILKKDGILCIQDEFCDGFLFDGATSWIIYHLTRIKNPTLSSIFLKMGAMSAGVGVCFLSEKMWTDFLSQGGLHVTEIKQSNIYKLRNIMKVCLMNKRHTRDNYIYAVRQ